MTTPTPQIYVASLAAYNAGHLHGEWIDCDQSAEAIHEEIQEMLKDSPVWGEDWAIHDTDDFFGISIDEHEEIEQVAELGQAITKHGAAIAAYYSNYGKIEGFEDYYQGFYDDEEDFVYEYLESNGYLENLKKIGLDEIYLDIGKIAYDWFISDYNGLKMEGKTYVFVNH